MTACSDNLDLRQAVVDAFCKHMRGQPDVIVRAPGRVNLIGEHTDYNGGFVMPMAIDRGVWIALRYRGDGVVKLYSPDIGNGARFILDRMVHRNAHWCEYIKGVARALLDQGMSLCGWEGVVLGNVPRGAGLSSSAALELAAARAFMEVSDFEWDPVNMALAGQSAENKWVGVNCGVMDQMISACGRQGHAYLLDCRSLEGEHVPLPTGVCVVILDTATRRGLVSSAYNERRACCERAAAFFGQSLLRDVSLEDFEARAGDLEPLCRQRARHVLTEDQRTLAAAEAMRRGDAGELGRLMQQSHESLRDDFDVCNDALNLMVACAMRVEGCYGARMTGAGFGGCAVALVDKDAVEVFCTEVQEQYRAESGLEPAAYVVRAVAGAGRA